eukprot:66249_1
MSNSPHKKGNNFSLNINDDSKEEIVSDIQHAINKDENHCNKNMREPNNRLTINYKHTKNWFSADDKLDILNENEWYRGSIKETNGYSLCISFQDQNGNKTKWISIKSCSEIFKINCECTKECKDKNHLLAAYGTQTNYSYDEQIFLYNSNTINFNDIINNNLLKFIRYHMSNVNNSIDRFNQDFKFIQQQIIDCSSTSKLIAKYQEFYQELNISYKKSTKIQQNTNTNTMIVGHYINNLKSSQETNFENAIN